MYVLILICIHVFLVFFFHVDGWKLLEMTLISDLGSLVLLELTSFFLTQPNAQGLCDNSTYSAWKLWTLFKYLKNCHFLIY